MKVDCILNKYKKEKKMNKLVKFRQTPEQKVYFISDLHHYHRPRWTVPLHEQRGYKTGEEMDEDQIETINRIVRPNDILWHLGDITLNANNELFDKLLGRINCQSIFTLWGNHNSPSWAIYQREVETWTCWNESGMQPGSGELNGTEPMCEVYPLRYKNLVFFGNYQEIAVDGQMMVLQHYPIHVWNNMKDGVWHLCGHSHYNCPFSKADNLDAKVLDVGWDGQLKPYSMEELREIMNKKKVFDAGDHHTN